MFGPPKSLLRRCLWIQSPTHKVFGRLGFGRPWSNPCLSDRSSEKRALMWTIVARGFKYVSFHPYLGKLSSLTNHSFEMGWNHQLVDSWQFVDCMIEKLLDTRAFTIGWWFFLRELPNSYPFKSPKSVCFVLTMCSIKTAPCVLGWSPHLVSLVKGLTQPIYN